MKPFGLLLHFYRHYVAAAGLVISLICWYYMYSTGKGSIVFLSIFKVVTDVLILYFVSSFRSKQFLYYYNRHLAKYMLWGTAFAVDTIIFILGSWMALQIH
ncbi:MAG: hypothetical protein ACTHJ0_01805 [Flavipsychrobacter sp.]